MRKVDLDGSIIMMSMQIAAAAPAADHPAAPSAARDRRARLQADDDKEVSPAGRGSGGP